MTNGDFWAVTNREELGADIQKIETKRYSKNTTGCAPPPSLPGILRPRMNTVLRLGVRGNWIEGRGEKNLPMMLCTEKQTQA